MSTFTVTVPSYDVEVEDQGNGRYRVEGYVAMDLDDMRRQAHAASVNAWAETAMYTAIADAIDARQPKPLDGAKEGDVWSLTIEGEDGEFTGFTFPGKNLALSPRSVRLGDVVNRRTRHLVTSATLLVRDGKVVGK